MTSRQNERPARGANSPKGKLFGVPVGGFGLFLSLLLALATGVLTFFLTTFLAIVGITIYNGLGHNVNYADSYKLISFPIACVMLAVSLIFFATLWLRRKFSGN
jgi:hypothetical protein